ncbi:hypothetical protein [Mucilaginibacter pocheonensis]|uniref:Uncharacterized protein n=1 Tax=Mucilaginibacter pocheonensis TaxID=398050 RepID=A0ABU1T9Z1_9SPHI|nr:hypothetical protein [Mucilaginibacter pocheonensis]MDR6942202.1 hypothetical protein [Mucilaginibacter pocheonensis]
MNTADYVWNLVAKKLANDASEEELRELNTLMQEDPELNRILELMFNWWDNDEKAKVESNSHSLFNKIQDRIKTAEATNGNHIEQQNRTNANPYTENKETKPGTHFLKKNRDDQKLFKNCSKATA